MVGVVFVLFRLTSQMEQKWLLFLWYQWHVGQNTTRSNPRECVALGGRAAPLACSRKGTPPCLQVSCMAVTLWAHGRNLDEREAEICPSHSAGRWLLPEMAKPRITPPGDEPLCNWQYGAGAWWGGTAHGDNMAHHGTPRAARQAGTNRAPLFSPRAGTSCPSGRMGRAGRRPGRTAGTAMTTSSWTWEPSSSHMGQVQCYRPWCPAYLQPHSPCSSIPAAPGTSGPWCGTLWRPKITKRWQDFLTTAGCQEGF